MKIFRLQTKLPSLWICENICKANIGNGKEGIFIPISPNNALCVEQKLITIVLPIKSI